MRYTNTHIDRVIKRLNQYERLFKTGISIGRCPIDCDRPCMTCLLIWCADGSQGRMGAMHYSWRRYKKKRRLIRDWYEEMLRRANKRLEKQGWVIVRGVTKKQIQAFIDQGQ